MRIDEHTMVNWPWGADFAKELLEAIELVTSKGLARVDLENGTKVYRAGTIVRIDIPDTELM